MNLLAFDTSTEQLSIAVRRADRQWQHSGAGGRHSSAALIPGLLDLLADAGLRLADLDAIVIGRGPGSFTGLRTACSVAQGLALGAGVPVLPVDTLLAVAEQARLAHGTPQVLAILDARMDEVYSAPWSWQADAGWRSAGPTQVCAASELRLPAVAAHGDDRTQDQHSGCWALAGNVFDGTTPPLSLPPALQSLTAYPAWPTATALLSVAPQLLRAGGAVAPEEALPLYIRNKVARTVAERRAEAVSRAHG